MAEAHDYRGVPRAVNRGFPQRLRLATLFVESEDEALEPAGEIWVKRLLSALIVPMLLTLGCTPPADDAQPPVTTAAAASDAEPPAVAGPGWTGLAQPEEVIEARRVLMRDAERLMKPIDSFSVGAAADPAALRSAAVTLEAMLLALPHLFPPTTNLFETTGREPPTIALPAIWDRFAAFQTFAASSEGAAAALAVAADGEPLLAASKRLRTTCDTCHRAFTKPYTPPVVTDEDRNFDFESALPPN
jgi:cytochrome c556